MILRTSRMVLEGVEWTITCPFCYRKGRDAVRHEVELNGSKLTSYTCMAPHCQWMFYIKVMEQLDEGRFPQLI